MSAPPSPTLSDSALLDSLDEAFDLGAERERRMAAVRAQADKAKILRETEYGRVVTYGDEKRLVERMSNEKWCLIHFYHPDFPRCRIMDKHLDVLAPKHPHTLFLRASVADTPFLITKFGVQVLPCVHVFVDGRCVDRLIGFEELGDTDAFTTATLEFRLKASGVFPSGPIQLSTMLPAHLLATSRNQESDESDDERERERWAGKGSGGAGARRGKTGIRNGLASVGDDD
ncbi:hypothetical protein Q5752_006731 [Cryptotrichosporon argae]